MPLRIGNGCDKTREIYEVPCRRSCCTWMVGDDSGEGWVRVGGRWGFCGGWASKCRILVGSGVVVWCLCRDCCFLYMLFRLIFGSASHNASDLSRVTIGVKVGVRFASYGICLHYA